MDLQKICAAKQKELFKKSNVVGVGTGGKITGGQITDEEALIIFVENKVPRAELDEKDLVPQKIANFRTDVIDVGKIRLLSRTSLLRPAAPGCSIGHFRISAGTLGAIVHKKGSAQPYILSNNHVLANSSDGTDGRAKPGDPILQPGAYDGGTLENAVIASLERYVPLLRSAGPPACAWAGRLEKALNSLLRLFKPDYQLALVKQTGAANLVDAALARPLEPSMVTAVIIGLGAVTGTAEAAPGQRIAISGRTSGVRRGRILATSTTIRIALNSFETALFSDQFVTEGISAPGDSGSLVIDDHNRAVGLLFAGSDKVTICNRMANVLKALEIEI